MGDEMTAGEDCNAVKEDPTSAPALEHADRSGESC